MMQSRGKPRHADPSARPVAVHISRDPNGYPRLHGTPRARIGPDETAVDVEPGLGLRVPAFGAEPHFERGRERAAVGGLRQARGGPVMGTHMKKRNWYGERRNCGMRFTTLDNTFA